jgi:hypothetical protein
MEHEPLVTIALKEYNDLIKMRDNVMNEIFQRHNTLSAVGIILPWQDIVQSHKINSNGELYTYTRSITKDKP